MSGPDPTAYPHIRSGDVLIPDCSKGIYRPFRIGSREKRDLVRALAEKGLRGLDEYIDSGPTSGAIGDRLEELRKRIMEQAERIKASRRSAVDSEIERMRGSGVFGDSAAQDGLMEDPSSFRRFASERIRGAILADELVRMLETRETSGEAGEKAGAFRRFMEWIKRSLTRIWRAFLRLIGRFIALFRSGDRENDRQKAHARKGAISLPFPGLVKDLDRWEGEMNRKIGEDPHLQKAVNERISDRYGFSEGMVRLRSRTDPEWYRNEASRVLREEVAKKVGEEEARLKDLREGQETARSKRLDEKRSIEDAISRMERSFEKEVIEMDAKAAGSTRAEMRKELLSTLTFMGLLERSGETDGDYVITEALIEKFSELLYAELHGNLYGKRERRGRQASDTGVYDKDRLRTVHEESRMDMLSSIINSRINHPKDRGIEPADILVMREISTSELHAAILVDISGSMEENGRLEAAKRAVLALTQAIKRDNPRNTADIISVSTRARQVTLRQVMSMEPKGFTNFQEALAMARSLLEGSRSDRRLLFIITDGLPEAYIGEDGEPVAGDLEEAMERSLREMRSFRRLGEFSFITFLLEPEDRTYITAAKRLASEGGGNVIIADPSKLGMELLKGYYGSASVLSGI